MNSSEICFSLFFLFDLLVNFFVDAKNSRDTPNAHKNIKTVASEYLKGTFALDFIPLLPLHHIYLLFCDDIVVGRILLLIKMARLYSAFKLFNYRTFRSYIKGWQN